jgi:hypothetical protein
VLLAFRESIEQAAQFGKSCGKSEPCVYINTAPARTRIPLLILMFVELRVVCFMGKSLAAIAAFENILGAIA